MGFSGDAGWMLSGAKAPKGNDGEEDEEEEEEEEEEGGGEKRLLKGPTAWLGLVKGRSNGVEGKKGRRVGGGA